MGGYTAAAGRLRDMQHPFNVWLANARLYTRRHAKSLMSNECNSRPIQGNMHMMLPLPLP